jgi:protein-S-isoprenylcysteine O-methyltransferase Ste14
MISNRYFAKSVIALAVVLGVGSVILFSVAPLGSVAIALPWSEPACLGWDAALSLLFFLQHSGMIRPSFRARLSAHVPQPWHAAIYSVASGVALSAVILLWQPTATSLLRPSEAARWVCRACAFGALGFFAWGIRALRRFDPLGVAPIRAMLNGTPHRPLPFVIAGPYRRVRHPLYFSVLVLIWTNLDLTTDRLLFNVLWTAWIVVGTRLEERDLVHEFGNAYRVYQRVVPMLLPRLGRNPLLEAERPTSGAPGLCRELDAARPDRPLQMGS